MATPSPKLSTSSSWVSTWPLPQSVARRLWEEAIDDYVMEANLTSGIRDELLTQSTPDSFLKVIGTQWKKYISETEWTKTREVLSRFWDLLDIAGAALGLAATVHCFQRFKLNV